MDDIIEEIEDLPKWVKIALGAVIGVFGFIALIIGVAIIGAFISGFGGETAASPPNVHFTSNYTAEANELAVSHEGGDPISSANLALEVNGNERDWPVSGDFRVSEQLPCRKFPAETRSMSSGRAHLTVCSSRLHRSQPETVFVVCFFFRYLCRGVLSPL